MKKRRDISDSQARKTTPLEVVEMQEKGEVLRAAVYARVSSPKQKTVDAQIRLGRDRAREKGWKVAYILQDHAFQGDDLERPSFQRLMDLAERRAIDVVLVWKLDRLARSLAHAVALEEMLSSHGVAIHSCTEPVDTTSAVGRFLFGNLANAAQLEKSIIKERVRMGNFSQALEGRWLQPQVPLGYRRTKAKRLRVHEAEAAVVRRVFESYAEAGSYAEAALVLNAEGLVNRKKPWTGERVRQLVENRLYMGEFHASGVVKAMPKLAIVSRAVFERTQKLRARAVRRGKPASVLAKEAAMDAVFRQYLASLDQLSE